MGIPEVHPTIFELSNGLTIIVAEQHSVPLVSIQAWCQTGSVHEGQWLGAGLTHLLEHVLFNGTERRTSKQISDEIHGVGGYVNAYTSFDRTVFWVDCPTAAVRQSIDILGDMLFRSLIEPEPLEREMDIVRREFDMGLDDPDRVLSYLVFGTAFQVHPCRYPVIGIRGVFDQLTHADVLRYYQRRYLPNNLFLVIVGDVDLDRVRSDAEELLGFVKRGPLEPVILPEEPPQLGRRETSQSFKAELAYFNLGWHVPGVSHDDMAAVDAASVVLGGGASSRLYQQLREKEGLVYGVGAYAYTPGFPGLLTVSGQCAKEVAEMVPNRIVECVADRRERRFSEEELKKAKRIITVNAIEQFQTVKGVASDLGLNWLYARNLDFSRHYLERLQALTPADVERVVSRYVTDSNLTVAVLRPQNEAKRVSIWNKKTEDPQIHMLRSGTKVVLIPDRRLPMIYASAVFRGGSLYETVANNGIHRLVTQAMPKGTKVRSAEQIAEQIEGIGGMLFVESGYSTMRVAASSLSDDFSDAFAVMMDVAVNPVFPDEATERERESQIAALRAEKAQPQLVARNLLRAEIYGDHPYGLNPLGREETVDQLRQADLIRRHRTCFIFPNAVFGCCGDFDADRVLEMIDQLTPDLAEEKPLPPPPTWVQNDFKSRSVTCYEGRHQAVVCVGYLACTIESPDRISLEVLDEAAGDSSSRFFVKVREELGLAYSVGSSLFLGVAPGIFSLQVATAPENIERVTHILESELEKLCKHGLEPQEFERAKTRTLSQLDFQLQNMDVYAHSVALNELYGLGYDYVHRRRRKIESLTLDSVNEAARKYFMDKPAIKVIVRS
ncbi:MAG: insulinase family protein [Verrucomicrobia bacterium]|nr:insulinase family protein [Verrucomicrobiota bacterium]